MQLYSGIASWSNAWRFVGELCCGRIGGDHICQSNFHRKKKDENWIERGNKVLKVGVNRTPHIPGLLVGWAWP